MIVPSARRWKLTQAVLAVSLKNSLASVRVISETLYTFLSHCEQCLTRSSPSIDSQLTVHGAATFSDLSRSISTGSIMAIVPRLRPNHFLPRIARMVGAGTQDLP